MPIESKGDRIIFHTEYKDRDNKPIDVSIKQYGDSRGKIKEWLGEHFTKFFLPQNYGAVKVKLQIEGVEKEVYLDKTSLVKRLVELGVPLDEESGVIDQLKRSKDAANIIFCNIGAKPSSAGLSGFINNLARQNKDEILASDNNGAFKIRNGVGFSDVPSTLTQLKLNIDQAFKKFEKEKAEKAKKAAEEAQKVKDDQERTVGILEGIFGIFTPAVVEESSSEVSPMTEEEAEKFFREYDLRPSVKINSDKDGWSIGVNNCSFKSVSDADFDKLIKCFKKPEVTKLDLKGSHVSEISDKNFDKFLKSITESPQLKYLYISHAELSTDRSYKLSVAALSNIKLIIDSK